MSLISIWINMESSSYLYIMYFKTNTHWLNSIDNIISDVSSGRLVRNKIWLGGCSAGGPLSPKVASGGTVAPTGRLFGVSWAAFCRFSLDFFFLVAPSSLGTLGSFSFLGRSWKVPLLLAMTSESVLQYWMCWND